MTLENTANRASGKTLINFGSVKFIGTVGYVLCRAQSKPNLKASVFRNFQFQDGSIGASNEAQDPVPLPGSHACIPAPGWQCIDKNV